MESLLFPQKEVLGGLSYPKTSLLGSVEKQISVKKSTKELSYLLHEFKTLGFSVTTNEICGTPQNDTLGVLTSSQILFLVKTRSKQFTQLKNLNCLYFSHFGLCCQKSLEILVFQINKTWIIK